MPSDRANTRNGGRILVDALVVHGVDTVFCVPGESYLAALDALGDVQAAIRTIVCRHESGAAFAAEAYGKFTGRPGIAFVTRGPGACNAAIGVHTAWQDSTPMVLFVGQIPTRFTDREAFQEVDYRQMFAGLAKWATQIDDVARIPELVARAFQVATSGRPGPVVVAVPEDMLMARAAVADARRYTPVQAGPAAAGMAALRDMLAAAERPLAVVGGGGWTAAAVDDLAAFCVANGLATMAAFRCLDLVDNAADHYVGEMGIGIDARLAARIGEADLLLAIGVRLGEIATQGYTLLDVPTPAQRLIHVHADAAELGRVYQPDLAIASGMAAFTAAARALDPVDGARWADWRAAARADYLAWAEATGNPGPLDMGAVMAEMRAQLPDDAIITNDAGNFAGWAARHYTFRRFRTQLGPTNGAMGYGVPAALAAKAAAPARTVVAFAGDGGILMTGNEVATALQFGLPFVVIVVNNGMYGTIRMHQERAFPGRVFGTDLRNPNFAAWAEAFGAVGYRVGETAEFGPALAAALASDRVAVIELMLDPDVISTQTTISAMRRRAGIPADA